MTLDLAKQIALAVVRTWRERDFLVSLPPCSGGYQVVGTHTGRWCGHFDPQRVYRPGDLVANGNGDIFMPVEINATDIEQRTVRLMHGQPFEEVPPYSPSPDVWKEVGARFAVFARRI